MMYVCRDHNGVLYYLAHAIVMDGRDVETYWVKYSGSATLFNALAAEDECRRYNGRYTKPVEG